MAQVAQEILEEGKDYSIRFPDGKEIRALYEGLLDKNHLFTFRAEWGEGIISLCLPERSVLCIEDRILIKDEPVGSTVILPRNSSHGRMGYRETLLRLEEAGL